MNAKAEERFHMLHTATKTKSAARKWRLPESGEVIAGKYLILRRIGQGGLAAVFAALHQQLEQRVALKMLMPQWANNEDVVSRFVREGRAATRVRSEHVVRVLDVDATPEGAPYLVLEYLEGTDLEELLAREGPQPVSRAVDWMLQACEALACAHAEGVIHRDLKPANIFLTKGADGRELVKILDFGIAKVAKRIDLPLADSPERSEPTDPADVMGSPHYMSPEQMQSTAQVDARADIWAMGTILHELLTGKPPFPGNSGPQVCVNVMQGLAIPISSVREGVPEGLTATVLLCLEKDPAQRFANAGELALALAAYGTPATAHGTAERTLRILRTAGLLPEAPALPNPDPEPRREGDEASTGDAVPLVQIPRDTIPDLARRDPDLHFRLPRRSYGLVLGFLLLALFTVFGGVIYALRQDAARPQARPAHASSTPPSNAAARAR